MAHKLKILFFIICILLSCQKREWNNPFDPDCPKEIYTPTNFKATQQDNTVKLTWSQLNNNISGFKIMRSINDVNWTEIGNLDKNIFTLTDSNISGGEKYTYKIVAVAGKNESNEKVISLTPILSAILTTTAASAITSTTAISGGNITNDGGAKVTSRGVCYGVAQNPTISGNKTTNGSGKGTFVSNISGLTPSTTYYIRAYATNSNGTAYGNQLSFKTSGNLPSENYEVIINVIDVDAWSVYNPVLTGAANAKVSILDHDNPNKNEPLYEGITDSDGKLILPNILPDDYFVYIEKGNQSNVIEQEIIDGQEVGYIIIGIFMNAEQLASYAVSPCAWVGDPRLLDLNEDGIINKYDKAVGNEITISQNSTFTFFISEQ